ncbi:hypothetical protein [Thalassobacillus sp. B23F22_16]|uniref:hypothetical protein n=1 Tax=Thalassobacillus sp. B23F22_16 TaxID=3459513 RepID=UPI00373E0617
MKHGLVVGGTGMLAETTLWLADQGYHVSVVEVRTNIKPGFHVNPGFSYVKKELPLLARC